MGVPSIPLGGVDVTICLGDKTVTQHCRVLDTDAFDIVIGTDFLRRNPQVKMLSLQRERVSGIPCLLLILKTLIAFQKMLPQKCKKVKSTNKEHHKQDQSQNCDSSLPNQSIVSKGGLHIDK